MATKSRSITKQAEQLMELNRVKNTHDLFCDSLMEAHAGMREAVSVASIGQADLDQSFAAGDSDEFLELGDVLGRIELMAASLRELNARRRRGDRR